MIAATPQAPHPASSTPCLPFSLFSNHQNAPSEILSILHHCSPTTPSGPENLTIPSQPASLPAFQITLDLPVHGNICCNRLPRCTRSHFGGFTNFLSSASRALISFITQPAPTNVLQNPRPAFSLLPAPDLDPELG